MAAQASNFTTMAHVPAADVPIFPLCHALPIFSPRDQYVLSIIVKVNGLTFLISKAPSVIYFSSVKNLFRFTSVKRIGLQFDRVK
jgi:hypothetical protein